jgi:signal transduction histidine kinase
MRQRTEEIGGTFQLTSSTGGTRVRAELLLEAS